MALKRFRAITGKNPDYFEGHAIFSEKFFQALENVAERQGLFYSNPVDKEWSEKYGIACSSFYHLDESMVAEYPIYQLKTRPADARMIRYPIAGTPSHHATVGVYNTTTNSTVFLKTGETVEHYLITQAEVNDPPSTLSGVFKTPARFTPPQTL